MFAQPASGGASPIARGSNAPARRREEESMNEKSMTEPGRHRVRVASGYSQLSDGSIVPTATALSVAALRGWRTRRAKQARRRLEGAEQLLLDLASTEVRPS